MYYASVCAIAKDEDLDIKEWIIYHLAIGFEHFLIYDNNSINPLKYKLKQFIDNKIVTVVDLTLTKNQQLSAYMNAITEWGMNTKWLAFIDIDEFFVPVLKSDIRDILDDYISYGGLGVNWNVFSSNGHISRPSGGILKNYTSCLGLNGHIKSIVRPKLIQYPVSAHHFKYKDGFCCVNEDFIPIKTFHTYPIGEKLRINHYYYKSQYDFYNKINRGLGTQMKSGAERKIEKFYSHLSLDTFTDNSILKFNSLCDKFSKLPITYLEKIIHADASQNLINGIKDINTYISVNEYSKAFDAYKRLVRYYPVFQLKLIGANLCFLQNKLQAGLNILQEMMKDGNLSEDELKQCYSVLKNYYVAMDKASIANQISDYIT
ncbi:MAG: glycosyltransferase family 2 protein [Desulfovibrionaceae bacterium]|nr:glycosyltransferase family 2 protein [Desulfovibrionaceae bacterium]